MIPRLLCILGLSFATLTAADPLPEDLLRQGLFEEEANHDLDKASASYRAVIAAHDRQRALAATATFRLGEIARKKNDREAAAAAFRTVVERFPEQTEIARLSRENLAALGMAPAGETPATPRTNDPEEVEIARLKEIARNSPDLVDGAGTDGWRPLHHASEKGWTRVVSYLLENHADPNSRTIKEQLTPLQIASIYGNLNSVNALLAAKADVNLVSGIYASPEGPFPIAVMDIKNAKGDWSALDLAILYDRREVARALIAVGADLKRVGPGDVRESYWLTSLALAISLKRDELAKNMIAAGAPLGIFGKVPTTTPLAVAVISNLEMVPVLLKAGADPNQPYSEEGVTPLHHAASFQRPETAKLLIESGADVNAKDASGSTPLHRLFAPEMVDLLVSKGADINAKNVAGMTPLEIFSARDFTGPNKEVIGAFLKHGATVEDPIALLRRCSEQNLSLVRDLIVYPREKRTDAILLSVSGGYSLESESAIYSSQPRPPRQLRPSSSQSHPKLIALEIRPTPGSPPPSLAEALSEAYNSDSGVYLQSIRILRRSTNDAIETVLAWEHKEEAALPKDWPALQWGDIVEVSVTNSYPGDQRPPSIRDLSATIPARNVTFRLGGLEIPKTIRGDSGFWLSIKTLSYLIPNIEQLADMAHMTIHRKGMVEPISVDLGKPSALRFRLIDGDSIKLTLNLAEINKLGGDDGASVVCQLMRHIGPGVEGSRVVYPPNLFNVFMRGSEYQSTDFSKILILRSGENWKPELINLKAWIDSLPPSDKWEEESEKISPTVPKFNQGDIMVLSENPDPNTGKTYRDIIDKIQRLETMTIARPRPRVIVPPPPAQAR